MVLLDGSVKRLVTFLNSMLKNTRQIKDGNDALMQYLECFEEPYQLPIEGKITNQ